MTRPDQQPDHAPQGRYSVRVRENMHTIDHHAIVDPFISTRVCPRGWRAALGVLLGRYEIQVTVDADPETVEKVLEIDPDYLGAYGSERRKAGDDHLNQALKDFVDTESVPSTQPDHALQGRRLDNDDMIALRDSARLTLQQTIETISEGVMAEHFAVSSLFANRFRRAMSHLLMARDELE